MVDSIHNFTATDRQKNPLEELIIAWISGAVSDISKEMIQSSFLEFIQKMVFFTLVLRNRFICFLHLFFFTVQSKIGVHIIPCMHYIWVTTVCASKSSPSSSLNLICTF